MYGLWVTRVVVRPINYFGTWFQRGEYIMIKILRPDSTVDPTMYSYNQKLVLRKPMIKFANLVGVNFFWECVAKNVWCVNSIEQ